MTRKARLRLVPVAATLVAALVYACAEQTGPGTLSGWFAIAPVFTSEAAGIVPVTAGRFVLRRTADGTVVKDTVITLGANADSVDLTLTVPLLNTTETFELTIALVGPAGDTVFRAGPLTVAPTTGGDPPPLLAVPLTYTGTGSAAASVAIASPDTALFFGGSILLQAQALDSAGQPIPGTPIEWRSLDTARVRVPEADSGRVVGNLQRGVARIVARLLTSQADTVQVTAQPVPNTITVDAGNNQSGPPGTPLAQPLVARVLAADALGVENVWVGFTIAAGGGTLSADSVLTGPDVALTLGAAGGQVVEARTALLSGATAVFSATLTASSLVSWINPSGGNWSLGANWSSGAPPGATDTVVIAASGEYTVTIDVTTSVALLVVGSATSAPTVALGSRPFGTTDGLVLTGSGGFLASDATLNGPGTVTVGSGAVLTLRRSTLNAPLVNQGLVQAEYLSAINASFTQAGTLIVTNDNFGNGAAVTVATGFTNQGDIQFTGGNPGSLTVTTGPLVNAPAATFSTLGTSARNLAFTLDNQGTMQVDAPTMLNRASAQHTNGGTLTLGANNLTIVQSGTSPSFTTSGTLTVGTGRTLTVSGAGTFDYTAGALQGTGLVSFQGGAVGAFTPGFLVDTLSLELVDATLNGPGMLTVAAGASLLVRRSTVNAGLVNQGLVQAEYLSAINGSFTQTGTLIVTNDNFGNGAALTVATGFINEGAIQFTGGNPGSFTITAGALVNAAGATISTLGASARNLTLVLVNQGTVQLDAPTTLNRASAPHASSGTLILGGGNLTVTQSGTAPSFTTTGTLTVGAGRTLTVGGGTFNYDAGTLGGTGLVSLQSACSAFFTPNFTVGPLGLEVVDATLGGGAGTVTVSSGATLLLRRATMNANLVNLGTVQAEYLTAIQAPITQQGLLIVTSDNFGNSAAVTAPGFTNSGTVQLTGNGTGTFTTSGTLTNVIGATVASIGSGSRVLNATFSSGGTLQVDQPLTLNNTGVSLSDLNGRIVLNANLTLNQDAGETFANSGAVTIGAGTTFDLNGGSFSHLRPGVISGTGTLDVSGTSVTLFEGDASPGTSPGILTVAGTFPQAATSTLTVELGGVSPGTQHDVLAVTGNATLGGGLSVSLINGYTPAMGDSLTVVTFGSRAGAFGTVTGLNPPGPDFLDPVFTATGLTLVADRSLGMAFVSDVSGDVNQVDLNTDSTAAGVTCSLAQCFEPRNLAIDRAGTLVAVPFRFSDMVLLLDPASGQYVDDVQDASFNEPYAAAFTADGSEIWVANKFGGGSDTGTVTVIDVASRTVVAVIEDESISSPEGIAIVAGRAWVPNRSRNSITIIDVATRAVVGSIDLPPSPPLNEPRYAVGTPDGALVYVSTNIDRVFKINTATLAATPITLPLGGSRNLAVHPRGTKVYVAQQNGGIAVVDVATDQVTSILFTGAGSTYGVGITRDGTLGFVTDEATGTLFVFDPATETPITNSRFPIRGFNTPRAIVAH
jgi:DNA-binding beta-propeller fold protein YncE